MNNKLWFIAVLILPFIFSCSSSTDGDVEIEDFELFEEDQQIGLSTIKVPSPVELYMFMQMADLSFNKSLLNPIDNLSRYISSYKKSLNFGVYASNLAYCTVFKQNRETLTYFSTTKQLADELGLTEGFDDSIVKRLDKNISNSDSLYFITNDSYSDVTNFLEQQGHSSLLPLMLTGAWIESVYIAISSIKSFSPENEIVLLIADQQFLLESILEIFEALPENEATQSLEDSLKDIQNSFDELYDNEDVRITKSQFEEIAKKIKTLRAEIIS